MEHHQQPHAIIIPYPLQGHIIPTVHLALKLASNGFSITFVNTHAIHHQTHKATGASDVFASARASGLDIRYELVSDGLPVGFDRCLNHDDFMGSLLHALGAHVEELVGRLLEEGKGPRPTCLVADTFFVWPSDVCRKFGLVHVSFWTEPALVFSLYYHLNLLRQNGHFDSKTENRKDMIDYIPGVDAIAPCDLMSYLQETDTTTVCHRIIFKAFASAKHADIVVCNTVESLESNTISGLKPSKPFYAVGPIFPRGFVKSPVATSLWTESDCTRWLDSKPSNSVLYISFGSYAHISKSDFEEIAMGILDSGVNFVWVLRPGVVSADEPDPLPVGFRDLADGRGLVVPWCCQIEVLSHTTIGGFLTHCGWNSILESVWCEVPMLCFPLLTDQFTNRRLVVEWGAGIDVGTGRDEVARRVVGLVGGEVGVGLRREVREVKKRVEVALGKEGSSTKNWDEFVEDLVGRSKKKSLVEKTNDIFPIFSNVSEETVGKTNGRVNGHFVE